MDKRIAIALSATLALVSAQVMQAQGADSLQTVRASDALNRIRRYTTSDVAMARLIADSLVRALPSDASVLPEALFAKASIAPSAADAEKDYSRIVNEFRFAPRVPDALMRLALLEGARSNRAGALRHLDRLLRDHGESAVRSRASLMAGRLRLEVNDPARGCELLAAAWASAGINERDVKDQAESLGAKCPMSVAERAQRDPAPLGILRAPREPASTTTILGTAQTAGERRRQRDSVLAVQAARRDSLAAAPVSKRGKPATPPARTAAVTPPPVAPRRDSAPVASVLVSQRQPKRDSAPPPVAVAVRRDTVVPPAARTPVTATASVTTAVTVPVRRDTAPAPVVRAEPVTRTVPVSAPRRDTTPTAVVRTEAVTPKVPTTAPTLPSAVSGGTVASATPAAMRYAVQFAAYNDRPGAEQFAQTLQRRGIAARVEGIEKPFRVRAGRFATRAEAEATLQLWKKPGQAAIVVSYP